MFSLTDTDLKKIILGCGDGPASFNAELSCRGGKVVSIDPIYRFSASEIQSRIAEAYDEIMPQMQINKEKYLWESISSIDELGRIRMSAMKKFITDYEKGKAEGRYIEAALPNLDFKEKYFDIALCSHYLFLYSEHVSLDAHVKSLKALCRIAKEVRVYPLLTLDGKISPYLNEVVLALKNLNCLVSLADVKYQFQKGATQMLVVKSV